MTGGIRSDRGRAEYCTVSVERRVLEAARVNEVRMQKQRRREAQRGGRNEKRSQAALPSDVGASEASLASSHGFTYRYTSRYR